MAKTWNVVSTVADAPQTDPAAAPPVTPSKWKVTSIVKDPAEGDVFTGGTVPSGFHVVTGDDGVNSLRRDLTGGDIIGMVNDLPGFGTAAALGKGMVDLAGKAVSGLGSILSGDNADEARARRESLTTPELPASKDPLLHAMGAVNQFVADKTKPIDDAVSNMSPGARTTIEALEEAIPDVAAVAGARAPLKGVGPTVGEAVQSVKNTIAAPGEASRAAAGVGEQWHTAGLRTGGGHPIARQLATESGKDALIEHNSKVGNTVAASEAGHDPNMPMTYESLAQAREAPSAVYNRVARGLPDGQLDQAAREAVQAAGAPAGGRMTKGSPQAQQAITDLKAQLLDPDRVFSGQQMVNELRGLRQEGFVNAASEDVSNQQLGKAQLDIARALEGHISRNIPKGGDVTLQQFTEARKALAKNWSVQSALRGSDVDMKALGRVYRSDPELLDGGLKMLGEFAEGPGKDVVGIPDRYNPPGTLKDMAGVVNMHRLAQSTLEGIPGVGAGARRVLTGNTAKAIESAQRMFPPRAPGAFDPVPGLRPPPGQVGRNPPLQGSLGDLAQGPGPSPFELETGANPNPVAQAPMGDYATVLSEGLEQRPSPGLSAGPMGLPQGEGLPFTLDPDMVGAKPVQGGAPKQRRIVDDFGNLVDPDRVAREPVALGDRFARGAQPADRPASVIAERPTVPDPNAEPTLDDLLAELNDYAAVKSQGVPEGTAVRAGTRTGPSKPWLVDEDKPGNQRGFENLMEDIHGEEPFSNNASGQTDVSQEFANWQAERKAAGIKRYRYDPASEEMVPLHSTSARDPQSVKGRPVFDRDKSGKFTIIDRGGLTPSQLNGIIARMTQLGDVF